MTEELESCRHPDFVDQIEVETVRWFFRKGKIWSTFNGHDSLLIETNYRRKYNITMKTEKPDVENALKISQFAYSVLCGYYEVDLDEMVLKSIFWKGTLSIRRGLWFAGADNYPINHDVSAEIDKKHLALFGAESDLILQRIENIEFPVTLTIDNYQITWQSREDISTVYAKRSRWKKIFNSGRLNIRRGFPEKALFSDDVAPVDHVIFVLHGIDQKRHRDKIVTQANGIRRIAQYLMSEYYRHVKCRPMFIPIEWRSKVELQDDVLTTIPSSNTFLRRQFGPSVIEVLYYVSPQFRQTIMSVVTEILNKVYRLYVMYNPKFEEVKFSIVGHSLGAVIAYDVIKPWSIIRLYERRYDEVLENASKSKLVSDETKKRIEIARQCRTEVKKEVKSLTRLFMLSPGETVQLIFNVHNLYCLGSPLGAFLDTRGIRGRKLIPENLHRLFNIFFEADIIAYRLEPLLSTIFTRIEPLRIHSYGIKNPQAYESMPLIEILSKKPAINLKKVYEKLMSKEEPDISFDQKISRSIMVNLKTNKLPYRLDYVLPMSYLDMTNICKFHSAYWNNYDLIMFILYHSYGRPKYRKQKKLK